MDNFRTKFVDKYNDYDILTINKEYTMIWAPFGEKDRNTMLKKK